MTVSTVEIIKVTMPLEEYVTINKMISILEDIVYGCDIDTQKNIEKEWRKQDILFCVEDMLIALETLRDLETTKLDTE